MIPGVRWSDIDVSEAGETCATVLDAVGETVIGERSFLETVLSARSLGGILLASDPTYLLPFAGAFLVSTGLTLIAARLSSTAFDLDRLSHEIRKLDDSVIDGGSPVDVDEEVSE